MFFSLVSDFLKTGIFIVKTKGIMEKDRLVFSFDIEDFEDLDTLATAIRNVLLLAEDGGFLSRLQEELMEPKTIKRKKVTIKIYKQVDDSQPF